MTIRFTLDGTVLEGEHTFGEDVAEHLSKVVNALHRSKRCVVVTGAGISVSGGIPDFRSANGLYNLVKDRYPSAVLKGKDLFDASLFRDPITTSVFYTFMAELKQVVSKACPTRTHEFVKSLDKDNKLLRCYTQNIDCLEERLEMCCDMTKKQDLRIVQLHGDLNNVICNMCRTLYPFDDVKRDSFREGTPPSCENCENLQVVRELAGKRAVAVGTLRPNVVLYNEHHTQGDQIAEVAAFDVKKRPDMLIVMGTSLKVVGIKRLVKELGKSVHSAAKPGTVLFINNADVGSHSEWDSVFDYHILGKTDDVVERLED
ncbi:DHS-like NAD/FAD-binding domain-containing protein, partial [Fimicolochytrium jonesii]|uniref:DHS-like NAD/FAD-binding domain-containing protein n=1 Tax=Fimicolochytrium jonesii TaxID=1396493 RepID=UPI0022FE6D9C